MNRWVIHSLLVFSILIFAVHLDAQSEQSNQLQSSTAVRRDPAALAIVAHALDISGGVVWSNVRNYSISATTIQWDFAPNSWSVLIVGEQAGGHRFELHGGEGTARVELRNGAQGQFVVGNSGPQVMPGFIAVSAPIYFPLPYLAQIVSDPHVAVSSKGTVSLDGRSVLQIDVSTVFPTPANADASRLNHFTQRNLFFDVDSGVLLRISDYFYSPKNALSKISRNTDYQDYRTENGLTFPHLINEQLGSRMFASLTVQSIQLNSDLSASAFSFQH
jgi:hypothetical protein